MPVFHHSDPHPDNHPCRELTRQDIEFLTELQHILNTQDNFCTRPPLYWVIRQSTVIRCIQGEEDYITLHNTVTGEDMTNLSDILDTVENDSDSEFLGLNDLGLNQMTFENACDTLHDQYPHIFEIIYWQKAQEIVANAMFLTHAACEEHLRKYGYNYEPDAHAYAMHADRSPQLEQLLNIIQSVAWQEVATKDN